MGALVSPSVIGVLYSYAKNDDSALISIDAVRPALHGPKHGSPFQAPIVLLLKNDFSKVMSKSAFLFN